MFFTYLRRELRRRRKAALVVASGLALGIALVIVVNSVSNGMGKAQDKVHVVIVEVDPVDARLPKHPFLTAAQRCLESPPAGEAR